MSAKWEDREKADGSVLAMKGKNKAVMANTAIRALCWFGAPFFSDIACLEKSWASKIVLPP